MRKIFGAGRSQNPFAPFALNNIFERDVTGLALAEDQTPAKKIANQLNYNNEAYEHWYGYTGPAFATGEITKANIASFTPTVFIVPYNETTQKITFIKEGGEPQPAGESSNLQSYFEKVPVPDVTKVPGGAIVAEGTDKHICILRYNLDGTIELWECWKLEGTPGSYTMRYGGYIRNTREWNGIFPNNWGARATSLALTGGLITQQDLVEVLSGGSIKHALLMTIAVTDAPGPIAPATRQDRQVNVPELHEGKANPAYPNVDAVAEASWFRFPKSSSPSEFGMTGLLEKAIYEAIRKYGVFVGDGNTCRFVIESPLSSGSKYSYNKVFPLAGAPAVNLAPFGSGASFTYAQGLADYKLPLFSEKLYGSSGSIFSKQPWQNLELLAPRSS